MICHWTYCRPSVFHSERLLTIQLCQGLTKQQSDLCGHQRSSSMKISPRIKQSICDWAHLFLPRWQMRSPWFSPVKVDSKEQEVLFPKWWNRFCIVFSWFLQWFVKQCKWNRAEFFLLNRNTCRCLLCCVFSPFVIWSLALQDPCGSLTVLLD